MSVLPMAAAFAVGCGAPVPGPATTGTGREATVAADKEQPVAGGRSGVPAVLETLPPVAAPKDVPAELAKMFEERGRLHKRVSGARLTIAAKWVTDPKSEPAIRVDWTIDYAGPRRPFTIAAPWKSGTDVARAHLWYVRPDGTAAAFTYGWGGPPLDPRPWKDRSEFAVAADGQPLTGRLATGVTSLKGKFGGREPGPEDPRLWAQLEFKATDRGDGFDLVRDPVGRGLVEGPAWSFDAWTGHLWSPVVEVEFKE